MGLQVIVATMHQDASAIAGLKESLNLNGAHVLFVNQCDQTSDVISLDETTKLINSTQRGISKSRNLGLDHAEEDIVLIGDDDLVYLNGFEKKIQKAFETYPNAAVICFKSNKKNLFLHTQERQISYLTMTSVYSVQMAFRKNKIQEAKIRFNELFGTGSGMFSSGEENIVICECLKKGLECRYVPEEILHVPESESSWFTGFDTSYFFSKGALLYKLYGSFSFVMFLAFALLKRDGDLSLIQKLKAMSMGKRRLIELERVEHA